MKSLQKVKNLFFILSLLSGVNGFAQVPEKGPYIGLGFGSTAFDDNGMVKDVNYATGVGFSLDDTSSGFRVYGGYKFNKVVALEGAYTNYGDFKVSEDAFAYSFSFTPTALSISANLGYDFLDGQLRPFGILGLSHIDLDDWVDDDKVIGFHLGFGIEYNPSAFNGFGFRLAYEGDSFGVDTGISNNPYVDDSYIQAVGMLYISAHYRF